MGSLPRLYRTYNPGIKDPIIDEVATVLKKERLFDQRDVVAHLSGVSESTLDAWFDGDTVSPTTPTVRATLYALGYRPRWIKEHKVNIDEEIELADRWWRERNTKIAKSRTRTRRSRTTQKG